MSHSQRFLILFILFFFPPFFFSSPFLFVFWVVHARGHWNCLSLSLTLSPHLFLWPLWLWPLLEARLLFDWLMITYIVLFSTLLSRLTALACGSTWVTRFLARFLFLFFNIHRSGVLTSLAWLVPHETAAVSAQVLCTLHATPHT